MIKISEILFKRKAAQRAISYLLAVAAFFLLVIACSNDDVVEPGDRNAAALNVVVRNAVTGGIEQNARVTILAEESGDEVASALVSSRGAAVLQVSRGVHSFKVEKDGFLGVMSSADVLGVGQNNQTLDQTREVVIYPLTASITGFLFYRDPANPSVEHPAAGARVRFVLDPLPLLPNNALQTVFPEAPEVVTVGANGAYTFTKLPAGADIRGRIVFEPFNIAAEGETPVYLRRDPIEGVKLTGGTEVFDKVTLDEVARAFTLETNVVSVAPNGDVRIHFNDPIDPNFSIAPSALRSALTVNHQQSISEVEYGTWIVHKEISPGVLCDGASCWWAGCVEVQGLIIKTRDNWTAPTFTIRIPASTDEFVGLRNAENQRFAGATVTVNVTGIARFSVIGDRERRIPNTTTANQTITVHFSENIRGRGDMDEAIVTTSPSQPVNFALSVDSLNADGEVVATFNNRMTITPVGNWQEGTTTITIQNLTSVNNNRLADGKTEEIKVIVGNFVNLAETQVTGLTRTKPLEDVAVNAGTSTVDLRWNRVVGADAYEIFRRMPGENAFERVNMGTFVRRWNCGYIGDNDLPFAPWWKEFCDGCGRRILDYWDCDFTNIQILTDTTATGVVLNFDKNGDVAGIGSGTTQFVVQAVNKFSRSQMSDAISVRAFAEDVSGSNVTGLGNSTVNCASQSTNLTWNNVTGALSFEVRGRVKGEEDAPWTINRSGVQSGVEVDFVGGAISGRTFEFQVRAVGRNNTKSPWSAIREVKVVPTSITGLNVARMYDASVNQQSSIQCNTRYVAFAWDNIANDMQGVDDGHIGSTIQIREVDQFGNELNNYWWWKSFSGNFATIDLWTNIGANTRYFQVRRLVGSCLVPGSDEWWSSSIEVKVNTTIQAPSNVAVTPSTVLCNTQTFNLTWEQSDFWEIHNMFSFNGSFEYTVWWNEVGTSNWGPTNISWNIDGSVFLNADVTLLNSVTSNPEPIGGRNIKFHVSAKYSVPAISCIEIHAESNVVSVTTVPLVAGFGVIANPLDLAGGAIPVALYFQGWSPYIHSDFLRYEIEWTHKRSGSVEASDIIVFSNQYATSGHSITVSTDGSGDVPNVEVDDVIEVRIRTVTNCSAGDWTVPVSVNIVDFGI